MRPRLLNRIRLAVARLVVGRPEGTPMSWRLARSLETLRDEINAAAPTRSKASDGTIGDTAHSSRVSDHNPNSAGVVRAMDVTDDAPTFSANALAEQVRALGLAGHPALGSGAYVIWRGRIASATYGWVWRGYSGSNPHNHHVHISVATAASGYDSTAPWGATEEDDMKPEDFDRIRAIVREETADLLAEVKQMRRGQKTFRHNEVKRDGKTSEQLDRIEKQGQ